MQTLTRHMLIEHLRAASTTPQALRQLPAWAFDQFYAAEEGRLQFESGYRSVIGAVLDDLMFGDEAAFALTTEDVEQLVHRLQRAAPADNESDDELDDE